MTGRNYKCIVLIDSDAELFKALQKLLVKFSISLHHATTGSEGLQVLRGDLCPGLIIVGDNLRDIATVEIVPTISKLHPGAAIGIITNHFNHLLIDSCRKDGINNFFLRPLNLGQLIIQMRNMLEKAAERVKGNSAPQSETISAKGLRLEAEMFFTIKDISESGCCLRSPFKLDENDILVLTCRELSHKLSIDEATSFPFRVAQSKLTESGKYYDVGGQFIGIPPEVKSRLRSACLSVKGFKATRST